MRVVTFSQRHLVIALFLGLIGCGGRQPQIAAVPAPDRPEATVDEFLTAANRNDLDRMAMLWGDADGPSSVTNKIPLEQRQQRLQIMQRLLRNDSRTLTVTDSNQAGRRVVSASLLQGTRRFVVPFTCVTARTGGWLINDVGLEAAMPARNSGN